MSPGPKSKLCWNAQRRHYYARFQVNGKRRYFVLGKDMATAQARLDDLLIQHGRSIAFVRAQGLSDSSEEVLSVRDICDRYLEAQRENQTTSKKHIEDNIAWHLDRLCAFDFGDGLTLGAILLPSVNDAHLRSYLGTQRRRTWGTTMCHHAAIHAKAAMRWAERAGLIPRNPWAIVPAPPQARTERRVMSAAELKAILEAAEGANAVLLTLLYETAARPSELARARWENIRTDMIVLREHKTARKGKGDRVLYLSAAARQALDSLPGSRKGLILPSPKGRVASPVCIRRILAGAIGAIRNTRTRKQCAGITPYSFRHSRATHLVEAGVDVATVARILGNSPELVLRNYAWPTPDHVRKALEGR